MVLKFVQKTEKWQKIQFCHFWIFCHFSVFWKNFKTNIYNTFFTYIIIFPKIFCAIETKNSTFQSHKKAQFSRTIVQTMHIKLGTKMGFWLLYKICAISQEKWVFLWLWKVLFLGSMGQNLLGKTIKCRKIILQNTFWLLRKMKFWKYECDNWSDLTVCHIEKIHYKQFLWLILATFALKIQ